MTAGISARTPQHALAALLDLHRPKRLLLVGASQFPALDAFRALRGRDARIEPLLRRRGLDRTG